MGGLTPDLPATAGSAESVRTVDAGALLRLEHEVADILLGTTSSESEVFVALLRAIGTALRWPVGSVWQAHSSSELRCVATWSSPDFDSAFFLEESRSAPLPLGVGLPGR
ncbi:MAG TPA: hypothetical protein VE441_18115, partial [Mycobacterium sp.]|nr:hypothetical protein [Mycobacterium sp.]